MSIPENSDFYILMLLVDIYLVLTECKTVLDPGGERLLEENRRDIKMTKQKPRLPKGLLSGKGGTSYMHYMLAKWSFTNAN